MKIVLASASPRREELLKKIVDDFEIIISSFNEEGVEFKGKCEEYVKELAIGKAEQVSHHLAEESLVIGCDTIVYHSGKVLGKPKTKAEAFDMLKKLSGTSHFVYSGLAVVNSLTKDVWSDCVCTEVFFSELTDKEINKYIETGEPMDKAGAYGIQGNGGIFVEKIHGCYYNVVGLPLNRLYHRLKEMGVNL